MRAHGGARSDLASGRAETKSRKRFVFPVLLVTNGSFFKGDLGMSEHEGTGSHILICVFS